MTIHWKGKGKGKGKGIQNMWGAGEMNESWSSQGGNEFEKLSGQVDYLEKGGNKEIREVMGSELKGEWEKIEITVDSGAVDTVAPKEVG